MFFDLGIQGGFFSLGLPSVANQLSLLIYICAPLTQLVRAMPIGRLNDVSSMISFAENGANANLLDASPTVGTNDASTATTLTGC